MNLSEFLKTNGISQSRFANDVGVTQSYVSQVLAGLYKPKGKTALKWSEATGWRVTPHELNSEDYPNATDGVPEPNQSAAQKCAPFRNSPTEQSV